MRAKVVVLLSGVTASLASLAISPDDLWGTPARVAIVALVVCGCAMYKVHLDYIREEKRRYPRFY